jgi:glycosyltransferase involved in cell wall biosynthesis
MKLLALSRFGRLGASSRLRTLQYLPWLRQAGIETVHHALLSDTYLEALYRHELAPLAVLRGYADRVRALLDAERFDVVFMEKEALPWVPALIETSLLPQTTPIVVDYDDALFHRYDCHPRWLVRRLLGTKIDTIMKRCSMVIAGNSYLQDHAIKAGCRRVEVIPTVIDLARYQSRPHSGSPAMEVVVGWIGSPATAHYLQAVAGPLRRLRTRHAVRCVAIGARPDQVVGTPFSATQWQEDTEAEVLRSLDVGIMPLLDGPWERGKCGYKLIQYMACGVPVVASAVGANADIVTNGENGFLVRSPEEWSEAMERLIVDSSLRRRMGLAGRDCVVRRFCLQVQAPRLLDLLRAVARH